MRKWMATCPRTPYTATVVKTRKTETGNKHAIAPMTGPPAALAAAAGNVSSRGSDVSDSDGDSSSGEESAARRAGQ
jgi:hypothetical protein